MLCVRDMGALLDGTKVYCQFASNATLKLCHRRKFVGRSGSVSLSVLGVISRGVVVGGVQTLNFGVKQVICFGGRVRRLIFCGGGGVVVSFIV